MSLTGALSNAITGLNAASRSAQVVSSNLSNVMTEGYGRREVELGAQYGVGAGGVQLTGVTRHQNTTLISEMRMANSSLAYDESLSGFHTRLERLVGTPDSASSLTSLVADLEASLVSAASRPDLSGRLDMVVQSMAAVAQSLDDVSSGIQTMRREADSSIAQAVEQINTQLLQVEELNGEIARNHSGGFDTSGLHDQRQLLIDDIAEWVPLKEVARGHGRVALYTVGGAQLVDGPAAQLSFTNAQIIVPQMTIDAGLLSGLSVNGVEASTNSETGPLRGGKLVALFDLRDHEAVGAQAELDAVARDLVERFQDPALDATRGTGDAGLLTDGGAAFDPLDEVGLSGRLTVNALVDEAQGGASWRVRDGLGAATIGPEGNASLISDYYDALGATRTIASGKFAGEDRTAAQLGGSFVGDIGATRLTNERSLSFSSMRATELSTLILAEGVDSDQEMQKLMLIEQAYAANARMLQTVDEMMDTLMRSI